MGLDEGKCQGECNDCFTESIKFTIDDNDIKIVEQQTNYNRKLYLISNPKGKQVSYEMKRGFKGASCNLHDNITVEFYKRGEINWSGGNPATAQFNVPFSGSLVGHRERVLNVLLGESNSEKYSYKFKTCSDEAKVDLIVLPDIKYKVEFSKQKTKSVEYGAANHLQGIKKGTIETDEDAKALKLSTEYDDITIEISSPIEGKAILASLKKLFNILRSFKNLKQEVQKVLLGGEAEGEEEGGEFKTKYIDFGIKESNIAISLEWKYDLPKGNTELGSAYTLAVNCTPLIGGSVTFKLIPIAIKGLAYVGVAAATTGIGAVLTLLTKILEFSLEVQEWLKKGGIEAEIYINLKLGVGLELNGSGTYSTVNPIKIDINAGPKVDVVLSGGVKGKIKRLNVEAKGEISASIAFYIFVALKTDDKKPQLNFSVGSKIQPFTIKVTAAACVELFGFKPSIGGEVKFEFGEEKTYEIYKDFIKLGKE